MNSAGNSYKALLQAGLILATAATPVRHAVAQTCVPPPAGLVSWWPGEGDANDIQDDHHGTLMNGASFTVGKVGQAFSFDGFDDRIDIADALTLRPQQLTIDAWIKLAQLTGTHQCIVCKEVLGTLVSKIASRKNRYS